MDSNEVKTLLIGMARLATAANEARSYDLEQRIKLADPSP